MKNKKSKKDFFKKIKNIVKKTSESELKKSKENKSKRKNKPKGMAAKRFGVVTYWFIFMFMFLVTILSVFGDDNSSSLNEVEIENNKLFNNEGLEFAKDFVFDYFTWTTDKHGRDKRIANLDRYLMGEIDDLGGIFYNKDWSSSIDKRDIVLKDVQKISDEQARYIFKVKFVLKSKTDEENTQIDMDKLDFEEYMKEERKMKVINGYKTKVNEKFISVPIYYNKELNRFGVFSLPSFTFIREGKLDDQLSDNLSKLEILSDGYVESNIQAFLETFFESYSKDGRDKLNYILEDERHQNGLNGSMEFSSIKDVIIRKADDNNNKFIVDSEIVLKDPVTEFEFSNKYMLVIKRKDQRYIVESLNNEQYISEIVKNYIESLGEEESNGNKNTENTEKGEEDFNYHKEDLEEFNEEN